jgi:pilus assembly protein CpaB
MLRFAIFALSLGAGILATVFMFKDEDVSAAVALVPEPVEAAPMAEVLVAAYDLAQGDVLTERSVYWHPWPETAVSSAFIIRTDRPDAPLELTGRFVRGPFIAGEPIRPERLASVDARLLSSNLPAGRRAVALRVSAESTAGGFVLPNDRVDVLLTATEETTSGSRAASRIIARNVRVLAIDQLVESAEADAVIGSTATLELAERQVEAVLAAAASGMLSLALRSAADHQLIEQDPEPPHIPRQVAVAPTAPMPVALEAPKTVRMRRGTQLETVTLH